MKIPFKDEVDELVEMFKSICGSRTESRALEAFRQHRASVLAEIPAMSKTLHEYPVYGALAFLGTFLFEEAPELEELVVNPDVELLEAIRAKKAVKITGEQELHAWGHLRENQPKTACVILAICFLASKEKKLAKVHQAAA